MVVVMLENEGRWWRGLALVRTLQKTRTWRPWLLPAWREVEHWWPSLPYWSSWSTTFLELSARFVSEKLFLGQKMKMIMSFDVFAFQVGDYLTAGPCIQDASCEWKHFLLSISPSDKFYWEFFPKDLGIGLLRPTIIQMNQSKIWNYE